MRNGDLWIQLRDFQIDEPGARVAFEAKLAGKENWTLEFSRRAVEEYRRFIFLCLESGHPCSPSETVDKVWHLHLTYTRSYWDRMCGEVLGKPLHHDPSKGGEEEAAKFDHWRARTLESYRRLFGSEPPADIWLDEPTRKAHKPLFKHALLSVLLLVTGASLMSCGGAPMAVGVVLVVALIIGVVIIAIGSASRRGVRGPQGEPYPSSDSCGGDTGDSGCGGGD